jgi:hypothetical protein
MGNTSEGGAFHAANVSNNPCPHIDDAHVVHVKPKSPPAHVDDVLEATTSPRRHFEDPFEVPLPAARKAPDGTPQAGGVKGLWCSTAPQGTNYALSPVDGYEGLLLDAISPALAQRAYPYLATPLTDAVMRSLLVLGSIISTPAVINGDLPLPLVYVSAVCIVPALHRLALVDLRVLRLLLRQVSDSFFYGHASVKGSHGLCGVLTMVKRFHLFSPNSSSAGGIYLAFQYSRYAWGPGPSYPDHAGRERSSTRSQ